MQGHCNRLKYSLLITLTDTLVSCSPHEITHLEDFKDLKPSVIDGLINCGGLIDLTALLVTRGAINAFAENNSKFADIVAIYRWAISVKLCHTKVLLRMSSQESQLTVSSTGSYPDGEA